MSPDIRMANLMLAAVIGALFFALPNFAPKGMLFGVPVPQGFRESGVGRKAIARFRRAVGGAWLASLLTLMLLPEAWMPPAAMVLWMLSMALLSNGMYYLQNRELRPHTVNLERNTSMQISNEEDRLPAWLWLNATPLLMLAGAALYTYANWETVPTRYPVWWSGDGNPQRWIDKNAGAVFGPLGYAALQVVLLIAMQLLTWFGSRRNEMRGLIGKSMLAMGFFMAGLPAFVAVRALSAPSRAASLAGLLVPILPLAMMLWFVWRGRMIDPEPTPNECWHGGMIYYNPNDAALFVQRRDSIGITLNFANRWGWLMIGLWVLLAATRAMITHR